MQVLKQTFGKLLTLAREAGLPAEPGEVEVESLVPDALRDLPVDAFMEQLPDVNAGWQERYAALDAGASLGYVGLIEHGRLSVGVRVVAAHSPLSVLEGTDSLIAFTTTRYERPLVVFGPGAGPDVTAAGTLADIVHAAMRMGERL